MSRLHQRAKLGFPYDLNSKEVARFLIERGASILEKGENAVADKAACADRAA